MLCLRKDTKDIRRHRLNSQQRATENGNHDDW